MSFDAAPVKKKSKLPLILGLVVGGGLLCLACCGGCVYFVGQQFKAPLDATIAEMSSNAEITEKLGTPLEPDLNGIQLRNLQNNNGNGGADLTFNVKGPKGTARVDVVLKLTAGVWRVETLNAECSDGSQVSMGDAPAAGGGDTADDGGLSVESPDNDAQQ